MNFNHRAKHQQMSYQVFISVAYPPEACDGRHTFYRKYRKDALTIEYFTVNWAYKRLSGVLWKLAKSGLHFNFHEKGNISSTL